ncbi:MAG TPA: hypothetical protein VKV04_02285 [Verrucomicrobiae bacterium]|nr:hypothetical protein [Verrucomicrobiae bacterium]
MFNLETAIAEWRQQMIATGMKARGVLDELESHLREDIERRVKARTTEKEAFETAVRQLGQKDALTGEFAKIDETSGAFESIKQFFQTLAGIQNPILATNMNISSSNGSLEPAWTTYLKSGAFALPAAVLGLFVAIFVFPKFNEVVWRSGAVPLNTAFIRFIWNLTLFLAHYLFVVCAAFAFAIALLEWRVEKWRCYRKAACGVGVFLLNSAVLITITTMVILALVAAPALAHHAN